MSTTPPTGPSSQASVYPPQPPPPQIYYGWPPGSHSFQMQPPQATTVPPLPPAPLIREQAQCAFLILSSFPSLETPTTTKRTSKTKAADTTTLDNSPLTTTLLPESHPTFTADETRYLVTRPRRRAVQSHNPGMNPNVPPKHEMPLPPPPAKQRCAVTSWPAKYRDPKTGLAYADMHQYKVIQRVLAGGCSWSGLLGCWAGPSYGPMGRPAKGVPEGFGSELKVKT
jgi:vacuolar protein sorting-associated protein 72